MISPLEGEFSIDNLNTGFQLSKKVIVGISKISLRFRNNAYTNTAKNGEINMQYIPQIAHHGQNISIIGVKARFFQILTLHL